MTNISSIRSWILFGLVSLLTGCSLSKLPQIDGWSGNQFLAQQQHSSNQSKPKTALQQRLAKYQTLYDFEDWYDELYQHKNFNKFESFINKSLATDRQDEMTSSQLSHFYNVLGTIKNGQDNLTPEDEEQYQKQKTVLNEWIDSHPQSHIPLLLRGILQKDYAWEHRGSGYASEVSEEARKQFFENLKKANLDLENAAKIQPEDPNTWVQLLQVANGNGSTDKFNEYYQNALKADPFSSALRGAMTTILSPQWYGSREQLIDYAQEIDTEAKANQKSFLDLAVVGIYREINYHDENFMLQPEIWKKTQDIYNRRFAQNPQDVRTRIFYAYDAYITKRYEEAIKQFEIIGDRWANHTVWSSLEKYHSSRAYAYSQLAYEASNKGDYQKAETLELKAIELQPTAGSYLLLSFINGEITRNMEKTAKYARLALASNPTPEERQRAEANLKLAEELLNAVKH